MKLPGGIRFLCCDTADYSAETIRSLSIEQQAEINSIALEKRRVERALTYRLLNTLTDSFPVLKHRQDGSPYIEDLKLFISVTHCARCVAVAISNEHPIGIDAEIPTDRLVRIAPKFVSASESEFFKDSEELLRLWTIKEAAFKAAGHQGLSLRDDIQVTPIDSTEALVTVCLPHGLIRLKSQTDSHPEHTISIAFPR